MLLTNSSSRPNYRKFVKKQIGQYTRGCCCVFLFLSFVFCTVRYSQMMKPTGLLIGLLVILFLKFRLFITFPGCFVLVLPYRFKELDWTFNNMYMHTLFSGMQIVKHHSQEVALQRRVFVDFFCNPERLRSQVRELTARVRALQVS